MEQGRSHAARCNAADECSATYPTRSALMPSRTHVLALAIAAILPSLASTARSALIGLRYELPGFFIF
jgi:hypothetical protein